MTTGAVLRFRKGIASLWPRTAGCSNKIKIIRMLKSRRLREHHKNDLISCWRRKKILAPSVYFFSWFLINVILYNNGWAVSRNSFILVLYFYSNIFDVYSLTGKQIRSLAAMLLAEHNSDFLLLLLKIWEKFQWECCSYVLAAWLQIIAAMWNLLLLVKSLPEVKKI